MSSFTEGYDTFTRVAGANTAAIGGADYVHRVETEIENLVKNMNDFEGYATAVDKLKGNIAEYWHSGSFNIDAARLGSSDRTSVPASAGRNTPDNNTLGSPDIKSNFGDFSVKYTQNSAKDQAITNYERYMKYLAQTHSEKPLSYEQYTETLANKDKNTPLYSGQVRLIPSDQLKAGMQWLKEKIAKESVTRPDQVKRYEETLRLLSDKIQNSNGAESIPLTTAEAEEIAALAKEGAFDPVKWGLTTEQIIAFQDIMRQAYKAGMTAAIISIVLEIAPEIVNILSGMLKNGEISPEEFRRVGFSALKGSTLGFIRGTVASALTIASQTGKLGVAMKTLNPTLIGAGVAFVMGALQSATLLAYGKITTSVFAELCIQNLFITSCSLAVGSAVQTLTPAFPVLGFLLGSFVGSTIGAFAYKRVYNCVLSFCIDSGCTFFGLVTQDYVLPEHVLRNMGIQTFDYEKFQIKKFQPEQISRNPFQVSRLEPIKTKITFLRRGVIGVNRIGYVN